jgi:hypothetical protein
MEENVEGIKNSIDYIIGSNTRLKRKKKKEEDIQKELFCKIVTNIEKIHTRSILMEQEFSINLSNYDENFWEVIDSLVVFSFGKDIAELIFFYIYERISPDGSINAVVDEDGREIILNNPEELWELIQVLKNRKK